MRVAKFGQGDDFRQPGPHFLAVHSGVVLLHDRRGKDNAGNVQFMKDVEHIPFNTWWDAKKAEVEKLL